MTTLMILLVISNTYLLIGTVVVAVQQGQKIKAIKSKAQKYEMVEAAIRDSMEKLGMNN